MRFLRNGSDGSGSGDGGIEGEERVLALLCLHKCSHVYSRALT